MLKQTSFSGACFLAAALSLWTAALPAATPIDPSGIYLYNGIYMYNNAVNEELPARPDYLTINRNGDRYVVVDISRNLYYLSDMMLILPEETENNSIAPPIEEFALTFTAPDGSGGLIPQWEYRLEPVVPFPRSTAYLSSYPALGDYVYRTIVPVEPNAVCLQADMVIINRRCYIKIF